MLEAHDTKYAISNQVRATTATLPTMVFSLDDREGNITSSTLCHHMIWYPACYVGLGIIYLVPACIRRSVTIVTLDRRHVTTNWRLLLSKNDKLI